MFSGFIVFVDRHKVFVQTDFAFVWTQTHPGFVSRAHSGQSTNRSQDHLRFARLHHVEQQRNSIVLEDPLCSSIFSGQHNQVVGSL